MYDQEKVWLLCCDGYWNILPILRLLVIVNCNPSLGIVGYSKKFRS